MTVPEAMLSSAYCTGSGPNHGIGKADVARAGICCGVDKVSRALGFFGNLRLRYLPYNT